MPDTVDDDDEASSRSERLLVDRINGVLEGDLDGEEVVLLPLVEGLEDGMRRE